MFQINEGWAKVHRIKRISIIILAILNIIDFSALIKENN